MDVRYTAYMWVKNESGDGSSKFHYIGNGKEAAPLMWDMKAGQRLNIKNLGLIEVTEVNNEHYFSKDTEWRTLVINAERVFVKEEAKDKIIDWITKYRERGTQQIVLADGRVVKF
jgi:predicted nicotinamide N-methyase